MATNESQSPDAFSGVPGITPETIRAFKSLPESFDDLYNALKQDNPELAKEVFVDAHNTSENDMQRKRAFAAGALFMYGLLKFDRQYRIFESLLQESTNVDGDGEALQP